MYVPYQLMKLRAAAQHRLGAQARQAHNTRRTPGAAGAALLAGTGERHV